MGIAILLDDLRCFFTSSSSSSHILYKDSKEICQSSLKTPILMPDSCFLGAAVAGGIACKMRPRVYLLCVSMPCVLSRQKLFLRSFAQHDFDKILSDSRKPITSGIASLSSVMDRTRYTII